MDFYKVPIGFGMALAVNEPAMNALTGLCEDYMGNHQKAKDLLTESVRLNNENMLALFFEKFM